MYKYKSFTFVSNQCKFSLLKALVDQLTGEEAKDLLKEISKKMPFLVLDVADRLQAGPQSSPPRGEFPDWCVCTRCRPMETVQQHVCCGMRPELCHSINAVSFLYRDTFNFSYKTWNKYLS